MSCFLQKLTSLNSCLCACACLHRYHPRVKSLVNSLTLDLGLVRVIGLGLGCLLLVCKGIHQGLGLGLGLGCLLLVCKGFTRG